MVRCRGCDAELAVGMLDDLKALAMGNMAEPLELQQRSNPIGTETLDIGCAVGDMAVRIVNGP